MTALTTTTWPTIRNAIVDVIEGLAPTWQSGVKFRRSKRSRSVRDWTKTTAVFRGFEVRRDRADTPEGPRDPSAILRNEAFTITVAYPVALGLYGINDIDDMETVIRDDARLIRDAVFSSGNYVTGQQAALPDPLPAIDDGDPDVWFQEIQFTAVYYEGQTLV